MMNIKETDFVNSLEKGLKVLLAFSDSKRSMTLSEVAEITGLSRAAARRFMLTYAHLGYLYTDGKYFELTSKVLSLGYNYISSLDITDISKPHMLNLVNSIHESCSIATLDDLDVVYIVRQQYSRIMNITLTVGSRLPAHVTSMGRVLMAYNDINQDELLDKIDYQEYTINTISNKEHLKEELDQVKKQGWVLVDQELEAGLRSISAPIFSKDGSVKYAMNISGHSSRVSKETMISSFLPPLLEACGHISDALKKL